MQDILYINLLHAKFNSQLSAYIVCFVIPRQSPRDIGLALSVRPTIPSILLSTLFVCPEPYLSTY